MALSDHAQIISTSGLASVPPGSQQPMSTLAEIGVLRNAVEVSPIKLAELSFEDGSRTHLAGSADKLTDHQNSRGYNIMMQAGKAVNVSMVPGVINVGANVGDLSSNPDFGLVKKQLPKKPRKVTKGQEWKLDKLRVPRYTSQERATQILRAINKYNAKDGLQSS